MQNAILIRFGELFLKGKNKGFFETTLLNNIKEKLVDFKCDIIKISGRVFVANYDIKNETKLLNKICNIFGIYSVSPTILLETSLENIAEYIKTIKLSDKTFRVTVNRADKSFPINSTEYSAKLGGIILKENPNSLVDLHNPNIEVSVDIRENNRTFIFYKTLPAVKGLPVGSSAGGLLLLSGGIDSPVAGFLMAKRGMPISALHFHSYPYTSEMAKQKVMDLAKILTEYCGNITLRIVSFTKIQEAIHKHCNCEYMITIMRRIMMRIAERISQENELKAIITGESLGQVASQTIESITVTNAVVKKIPIIRPLVAMDKEEITLISKKINTFETSILPYEDCCTVFLPKHPIIKPKIEKVVKEESKLDIDALIESAMQTIEIVELKNNM